jgi:arginyl-tRNA synthetase
MKKHLSKHLYKFIPLTQTEILSTIELPPTPELGDYAFPCFTLSKKLKQSPQEIAGNLSKKIQTGKIIEKVESRGPYINIFLNKTKLAKQVLLSIKKQKEEYGSSRVGKGKTIVIDMSSPNIAKPFGVGHLRSTIIGNSIAKISAFLGYKIKKVNYLGDWGTPFGKVIEGYKKFGSPTKLKQQPIKHLFEVYIKAADLDEEGRSWFKKLELGDKEALALWKQFRALSIAEFKQIYQTLKIEFDVYSGESVYNNKMSSTINKLREKNLLEKSEGALIVNLEKYGLGVALIQKSDNTTLYTTRDITAAIDRKKKYKFDKMIYEVGSEQKLHFKQVFKILDLMGYKWSKDCIHVDHGLYLDEDGKKFATRKGKTLFMQDIIDETKDLAKKEISKREKLPKKELENRALKIALAAIFYGDLKNYRSHDVHFNIKRFLSFEGNTGPYLLYTYARAKSILSKAKILPKNFSVTSLESLEKNLLFKLSQFPVVVLQAHESFSPNLIANYSYELSQSFNEFYHSCPVLNSSQESFRLTLVDSFSQTLQNALGLLGIETIENM